jgi:hypothetical protein
MVLRMLVLTGLTAIVILYYKLFLKLSRLKNSNIHI